MRTPNVNPIAVLVLARLTRAVVAEASIDVDEDQCKSEDLWQDIKVRNHLPLSKPMPYLCRYYLYGQLKATAERHSHYERALAV